MKTHLQPFLGSFTARLHVEGVSGHEGTRGDAEGHRPVRHHRQAADSPHEAAVGRAEVPGRVCMVSSLFIYWRDLVEPGGQFRQHFWHQSRAAFTQIIFDAFDVNSILGKVRQNMVFDAKDET